MALKDRLLAAAAGQTRPDQRWVSFHVVCCVEVSGTTVREREGSLRLRASDKILIFWILAAGPERREACKFPALEWT